MKKLEKIRKIVLEEIPRYTYLNKKGKRSKYRMYKFRLANYLMENKLEETVKWFRLLVETLEEENENNIRKTSN